MRVTNTNAKLQVTVSRAWTCTSFPFWILTFTKKLHNLTQMKVTLVLVTYLLVMFVIALYSSLLFKRIQMLSSFQWTTVLQLVVTLVRYTSVRVVFTVLSVLLKYIWQLVQTFFKTKKATKRKVWIYSLWLFATFLLLRLAWTTRTWSI